MNDGPSLAVKKYTYNSILINKFVTTKNQLTIINYK
jgi:hypothetical protein